MSIPFFQLHLRRSLYCKGRARIWQCARGVINLTWRDYPPIPVLMLCIQMGSYMRPTRHLPILSAAVAVLLVVGGCTSEPTDAPEGGSSSTTNHADASATQSGQPSSEQPPKDTEPTLAGIQTETKMNWSDNQGRRRMSATARQISWNESSLRGQALDFSAQLYENGKLTASIKAPKAVIDTKTQTVTATGGVVMESLERETKVRSEWVKWYAQKNKVIGNGGVKIESPDWNAEGAAFEADTSFENYTIMDSAKGLEP